MPYNLIGRMPAFEAVSSGSNPGGAEITEHLKLKGEIKINYGIIFVAIVVMLFVAFVAGYNTTHYENNKRTRILSAVWGFVITGIISAIILSIIAIGSYSSYMDIKVFKQTKYQQYYDTVVKYNTLVSQKRGGAELTDLKFQGIQQSIADFIRDCRTKVTTFNTAVEEKRIMSKNCLIGFLIFAPDDNITVLPLIPTDNERRGHGYTVNAYVKGETSVTVHPENATNNSER